MGLANAAGTESKSKNGLHRRGQRGFFMKITRRSLLANSMACATAVLAPPPAAAYGRTRVEIVDGKWRLNGRVTYAGAAAEGLLMNVRMVNAVFEDANRRTAPREFDPGRNTQSFLQQAPEYFAHGIRAFTIGLQGGDPGYEDSVNSAFQSDGALRKVYLARVSSVIDSCDRLGAAVILSCFYQRQDQLLRDEQAIRAAVAHVARWILRSGFRNLLLEITNEFGHRGFQHAILRSASGQAELIGIAKRTCPGLPVSSSGMGDGRIPAEVASAADYLTPHLNTTRIGDISRRITDLREFGKPVVVNEDDKTRALGARAGKICVESGASWGFMNVDLNQHYPFQFHGADDDPEVYATLQHLTTADDYFPPPDTEGGWRSLTDSREVRRTAGVNRDRLDEAFEWVRGSTKNGGLLVLRKGWLVYERYFGLGDRDATPNLASCGKSFTSCAVGILLGARPDLFPDGLNQKVFTPDYLPREAFPLADPRMKEIRLGHLLAMTAGIRGNNPAYVRGKQTMIDPAGPDGALACVDAVAFGQEGLYQQRRYSTKTLWCPPGEGYSYATSSAHLASVIVRQVSGEGTRGVPRRAHRPAPRLGALGLRLPERARRDAHAGRRRHCGSRHGYAAVRLPAGEGRALE